MARPVPAARRRAIAEAQLKYAPQERVLLDALATARSGAQASIRSARGTSSALQASIARARRPLAQAYGDAAATAGAARGDLLGHLASLGPAAAPFSAAVAREQAGTTSRAAQERANALSGLTLKGVQAAEGGVSAEANARSALQSQRAQIGQQLSGIVSDRGAFTVAQEGDIRAANRAAREAARGHTLTYKASTQNSKRTAKSQAAGRALTRRGQDLSHADRQAAAQRKRVGKNKVTGTQSGRAVDQINLAVDQINYLKSAHPSYTIRQWLQDGQALKDVKTQKVTYKVPQIKGSGPVASHDIINAAYDVALHGYLSPANRKALRGVHLPASWKRSPRQVRAGSRAAATAIGSLGLG